MTKLIFYPSLIILKQIATLDPFACPWPRAFTANATIVSVEEMPRLTRDWRKELNPTTAIGPCYVKVRPIDPKLTPVRSAMKLREEEKCAKRMKPADAAAAISGPPIRRIKGLSSGKVLCNPNAEISLKSQLVL